MMKKKKGCCTKLVLPDATKNPHGYQIVLNGGYVYGCARVLDRFAWGMSESYAENEKCLVIMALERLKERKGVFLEWVYC